MWPIIILCVTVSASAINSESFRKCCPTGQNLMKVTDLENTKFDEYKCRDSASNISSAMFVNDSVAVNYGIPEDCDLEMIQIDKNVISFSVDDDDCYDQLVLEVVNGTVKRIVPKTVRLVCKGINISSGAEVKIQSIRKCCDPGQMYDTVNNLCRNVEENNETTNEHQWLLKHLEANGEVFKFDNGLQCKSAEYDVQLNDENFTLTLNDSTLKIFNKMRNDTVLSPVGNWCVERDYTSKQLMGRVCTQDCASLGAFCIKKCCPIGQHYQPISCGGARSECVPTISHDTYFNFTEYINPIKKEHGFGDVLGLNMKLMCAIGKTVLNKSSPFDWHSLTADGRLRNNLGVQADYCLELFDWTRCGRPPVATSVVCFTPAVEGSVGKNFKLSVVLNSLSCVCLALTLVVYISIPELRNLHGMNLISQVSSMLFAISCLVRAQTDEYIPSRNLCAALGYGIYFGFVAAFVWLNVMCFDIWWTFGNIRNVQPLHKGRATRRQFFWYSLYAWGVSITLTLVVFLLDKFPVSHFLDANMGYYACWFGSAQNSKDDWPHYIFFVIPLGVMTSINFVLWLLTARHCARVKSEVHRLQAGSVGERAKRRFRGDQANFVLTGKLWVVMGAGWVTELLSTVLDSGTSSWVLTIIDTVNELQGVFIFIILVFKPKLYYLIKKRLGLEKPDGQKNGQSSSGRTSSTFVSRTISMDANARISVPNDNAKQN